jgi:hypothetical protein
MEEAGELGYFLIKYIEMFKLDHSVGTDRNESQIWFIPSNQSSISDYHASEAFLANCSKKTAERLTKIEKTIEDNYKLC